MQNYSVEGQSLASTNLQKTTSCSSDPSTFEGHPPRPPPPVSFNYQLCFHSNKLFLTICHNHVKPSRIFSSGTYKYFTSSLHHATQKVKSSLQLIVFWFGPVTVLVYLNKQTKPLKQNNKQTKKANSHINLKNQQSSSDLHFQRKYLLVTINCLQLSPNFANVRKVDRKLNNKQELLTCPNWDTHNS